MRGVPVLRKEGGVFRNGLGDQQVIERITMVHRQRVEGLTDVGAKLPDTSFHNDLPKRHSADQDIVARVRNKVAGPGPKLMVVREPPEKGMRVEEQSQASPSIAARISGGSAAKSGAI